MFANAAAKFNPECDYDFRWDDCNRLAVDLQVGRDSHICIVVGRSPGICREANVALIFLIFAIRTRDRANTSLTSRETVDGEATILKGRRLSDTQRTISALNVRHGQVPYAGRNERFPSPFARSGP